MTLPSLVQSHREKQTVIQLKKSYSVFSNAMLQAYNEHGSLDNWGVQMMGAGEDGRASGNDFKNKFINNIKPYLKVMKFCEFGNSSCETSPYKVVSLDGTAHTLADVKFVPHLVLADGTSITHLWFSASGNTTYGEIYVDLNGPKPPNQLGVDFFVFGLINTKLVPYGIDNVERFKGFSFDKLCSKNVKNRLNGYGCTAWVIYNENMEYLKCNDLKWNGKKKCK